MEHEKTMYRSIWQYAAAVVGVLCLCTPALGQQTQPNFLVIVLDDVGIEHLAPFDIQEGQPNPSYANTPILIDRDPQWLRFQDAWSLPLCSPTRAVIHKGLFPLRTNPNGSGIGKAIENEDTEWGLDSETHTDLLPQLLKTATPTAYKTGIFGKWHMGTGNPVDPDLAPSRAGYDRAEVYLKRQNPQPWSYYNYFVTVDGITPSEPETQYHTSDTVDRATAWINAQTGPWFA